MNQLIENSTASGAIPSLDDIEVLGAPESTKKSKTNAKKAFILLILLVAFVFIIIGIMWFIKGRNPSPKKVQEPTQKTTSVVKNNTVIESDVMEKAKADLKLKQAAEEKAKADREAEEAQNLAEQLANDSTKNKTAPAPNNQQQYPQQHSQQHSQTQATNSSDVKNRPLTAKERRLSGSAMVDLSKNEKSSNEVQSRLDQIQKNSGSSFINTSAQNNATNSGATGGLNASLQPTVLANRNAGKLSDLDYLLKRGAAIPCALETGIDTTLAGFVVCKVVSDVYSANGKTLLIERGASIFGEQQSALKQGQARTFVLWTRIDNPSGVTASLDSPATDQMGYNGIGGYVDTHFWTRFGGAILMSLIKDFSSAQSKSNPQLANTSQGGSDIATETLRNSINIPPTLTVLPATVVYVMVARDVNFSTVYTVVK